MKKSPVLAFLLSIVPGLGQIYAGAYGRGLALLLGLPLQALLFWLVRQPNLNAWLVLIWIWNLFDAACLARGRAASAALPVALLVALNILVGWRVTEIAPGTLARNLFNMKEIVVGLAQPDLVVPAVETQTGTASITIAPASDRTTSPAGNEVPAPPAARPASPPAAVPPAAPHPPPRVQGTGPGFPPTPHGR